MSENRKIQVLLCNVEEEKPVKDLREILKGISWVDLCDECSPLADWQPDYIHDNLRNCKFGIFLVHKAPREAIVRVTFIIASVDEVCKILLCV